MTLPRKIQQLGFRQHIKGSNSQQIKGKPDSAASYVAFAVLFIWLDIQKPNLHAEKPIFQPYFWNLNLIDLSMKALI